VSKIRPFSRDFFIKETRGSKYPAGIAERAAGLDVRMDAVWLRRKEELKRKDI
jgi:hypothetical protein